MKISTAQPILCSLISYYGQGNDSTFKKICNQVYPEQVHEKYFCTNMMLAANIAGLIDVLNRKALFKWNSSINDNCIKSGSLPLKEIGTTIEWFNNHQDDVCSLIIDKNHFSLIAGTVKNKINDTSSYKIFAKDFFSYMPTVAYIDKYICKNDYYSPIITENVQMFDLGNIAWSVMRNERYEEPCLVRIRKRFSGIHYYIVHPDLNLCFRISHPEWAFVFSLLHLGWEIGDFINYDYGILTIKTQFKLPTLLLRFLFSSSEYLKIGSNLEFFNIKKECSDLFFDYLNTFSGKRFK